MTPHTSRLRPDGTTFPPVTPDPPPPPGYVDPIPALESAMVSDADDGDAEGSGSAGRHAEPPVVDQGAEAPS